MFIFDEERNLRAVLVTEYYFKRNKTMYLFGVSRFVTGTKTLSNLPATMDPFFF